ncbi:glutathione S-transferase theta-3-like [Euwallacea fornicatus]|uniref:glutathione S-transferase theta-3-like n=1 Tax=Euwallacea fornicatus TaxID=995702 RepID=UPI00338EBD85
MAPLKLYYDLMSQPSRTVYIFLKLTKIPFQDCPVALRKNEQSSKEFKEQLNRFQKVPFIHHGDFKLAESTAIVSYLTREYRELVLDHWYPKNSKAQAKLEEYLAWHHINMRLPCATYAFYKWMIPILTKTPPDEEILSKHKGNLVKCLDQIKDLWLSKEPYFLGDHISVADIFAACELEHLKLANDDAFEGRPELIAWLERVRDVCNPVYDEAHAIVNKIAVKSNAKL